MNQFGRYTYIVIILSFLFLNTLTFAATIHVPAAQPTIQSGIDAAKDGDTVLVADGIYRGEGNVNIDFKGKQITVKSVNGAEMTIIDCKNRENTRGFTFESKETHASVLIGFTVKNGIHRNGGGIYCNDASPLIKNCVITENRAVDLANTSGSGGGIYAKDSDVHLSPCKITHNRANSKNGGGVFLVGDRISRIKPFQPIILNCTISENIGGGVYSTDHVNIWIKKCTVSRNIEGSGIVCTANMERGSHLITNCHIEFNQSKKGAGVLCTEHTILKITNSVIKANFGILGGGIFCSRTSTLEVSDCLIISNFAPQGGGILVESESGKATIKHCTITDNRAVDKGGGILAFINPNFNSEFTLSDSIVWGNYAHRGYPEIAPIGFRIIIKSCNIGGGQKNFNMPFKPDGDRFVYEDNIDADPLFVDVYNDDYRLKPNSPATGMGVQASHVGPLSVTSVGKRLVMWGELKRNK